MPAPHSCAWNPALRYENLQIDALIAGFGLTWAILLSTLVWQTTELNTPLRALMYVLCVAAALLPLSSRYRSLLISPLFLLGLVSALFYTIPAWFWIHPPFKRSIPLPADQTEMVERFIDGQGQLIVLQFSAVALLGALALERFDRMRKHATDAPRPGSPLNANMQKFAAVAAGMVLCGAGIIASSHFFPVVTEWMANGLGKELLHAAAPLIVVGAVTLVALAVGRPAQWTVLAVAGLTVSCAALLATFAAKTSVFLGLSGLAYFIAVHRMTRRMIAIACAGAMVFLAIMLILMSVMRDNAMNGLNLGEFSLVAIDAKLSMRQADTAGCFQSAIEKSLPTGKAETPFYYVSVFVPRALWHEKPNFSQGNEYAGAYCWGSPDPRHSASITLLGQPILRAGWAGLAVAQTTLIAGLLCITWLARRNRPIGPIALTALLPWLIDFDQDFALYVGNAVKMFLWMLPLLIPLSLAVRRDRMAENGPT